SPCRSRATGIRQFPRSPGPGVGGQGRRKGMAERRATGPPAEAGLPLVEELRPAPDAWDACRRLAHLPHLLFLDSALAGPPLGRWSFVAAAPFGWLRSRGGRLTWSLGAAEREERG